MAKQLCIGCQQEKFIIKDSLCSGCLMLVKTKAVEIIIPSNAKEPKPINCDSCGEQYPLEPFKSKNGKVLQLCASCFTTESEAAKQLTEELTGYKSWPKCEKCGAHVKTPIDGKCSNCVPKPVKADSPILIKPTDSNKYQEFFNQTVTEIADMTVEEIREFIIQTNDNIFSLEADLLREKARKQSALIKFNSILEKMNLDERNKLRIEDASYVPKASKVKTLKSPLSQVEKSKKIKKSLDDEINALFGGKLTPAEIQEKKKALGM